MPYEMRKQDGKFCIFNKDTGDNKGCSDSEEMAKAHMRALYVNESNKEYEMSVKEFQDNIENTSQSIVSAVLSGIKEVFHPTSVPSVIESGPFILTKQLDGRTRVVMRVSNNFKDRHREIITEVAHKEYEAYVKESGKYPQFWLWHTKGSKWGEADLVSYDDGFLTLSGLVDVGKEYIAEGLAKLGDQVGVSHGFRGISIQGKDLGYIDHYRMFEASPLPVTEAANIWTAYMLAKGWSMGLADKHKKFFADVGVPESIISGWDSDTKSLAQTLKEHGIEYKDLETEPVPEPEPQPDPKPGEPTLTSVMDAITSLSGKVDGIENKQKALETQVKDGIEQIIAPAIMPNGRGYVASKEGDAPSDQEKRAVDTWEDELSNLIMGVK